MSAQRNDVHKEAHDFIDGSLEKLHIEGNRLRAEAEEIAQKISEMKERQAELRSRLRSVRTRIDMLAPMSVASGMLSRMREGQ